jgi:hypothetical protein
MCTVGCGRDVRNCCMYCGLSRTSVYDQYSLHIALMCCNTPPKPATIMLPLTGTWRVACLTQEPCSATGIHMPRHCFYPLYSYAQCKDGCIYVYGTLPGTYLPAHCSCAVKGMHVHVLVITSKYTKLRCAIMTINNVCMRVYSSLALRHRVHARIHACACACACSNTCTHLLPCRFTSWRRKTTTTSRASSHKHAHAIQWYTGRRSHCARTLDNIVRACLIFSWTLLYG